MSCTQWFEWYGVWPKQTLSNCLWIIEFWDIRHFGGIYCSILFTISHLEVDKGFKQKQSTSVFFHEKEPKMNRKYIMKREHSSSSDTVPVGQQVLHSGERICKEFILHRWSEWMHEIHGRRQQYHVKLWPSNWSYGIYAKFWCKLNAGSSILQFVITTCHSKYLSSQ